VPDSTKVERHKALEALQEHVQNDINRRFLGQAVEVLVEDLHKGKWRGRTRLNKLVFFEDDADWRGRLAQVLVTWTGPYSMQGRLAANRPGASTLNLVMD
jgi:tRNA-2-methylthio-N6-dimethylallyladenosine synthase